MSWTVNINFPPFDAEVLRRLDLILENQGLSQEADTQTRMVIMSTLDEVVTKVAEEKTLVEGLKVFVHGLKDQIAAIPGITPAMQAQIDQVFTDVSANSAGIAEAMAANVTDVPPVVR